jgi:hypothetical protein
MTFFFDNNLGQFLVRGLEGFGEDVVHITEHFQGDESDEVWLEFVGKKGMFLITRDQKIRKRPIELEALKRFRVGAFFLGGKAMGRWDQIKQIIRAWPKIKEISNKTRRPFAYNVNRSGSKLVRLTLD